MLCLKKAESVANSVIPDETPRLRRLIWVYIVYSGLSGQIQYRVTYVKSQAQIDRWKYDQIFNDN